jgi:hypothetical protein
MSSSALVFFNSQMGIDGHFIYQKRQKESIKKTKVNGETKQKTIEKMLLIF